MFSIWSKSFACHTCVARVKLKSLLKEESYTHPCIPIYRNLSAADAPPGLLRGFDYLRDARLNKGLAFTLEERQALGLQGILAPSFKTQDMQLEIVSFGISRYANNLNKYLYLAELQDTNEKLFYRLLSTDIEKFMPIIYTPTVGLACQKFGLAYKKPKGLFISINDRGHIRKVMRNWPETDIKAVCFTDGERILGLGDLGAYGMGIPVGKLSLYTALGGIKPHTCLPIVLDVGTNNKDLLEDPMYIGLRQERVRGKEYDDFIEEFMDACVFRYGSKVLLQFEDFAYSNATRLLMKYRDKYCTFNDDIQGTASVAVAGLLAATKITGKKISQETIMFLGAGSAALGIASLTVLAMVEEGLEQKKAVERIYLFDVDGLLTKNRPEGIPVHAKLFKRDLEPNKSFIECVKKYKPTALIGCSTVGGSFTPEILKEMAKNAPRPIIFALSNPTSTAECTAQEAYDNTDGKCIYASGSPFPPVKYGGKTYITGQGNNSYIFPGVALGVIVAQCISMPDTLFLRAAKSCADYVKESDLQLGRIYPPLQDMTKVSLQIAIDTVKKAFHLGIATIPPPADYLKLVQSHLYSFEYESALPDFYPYPPEKKIKLKSVQEAFEGTSTPKRPQKKPYK